MIYIYIYINIMVQYNIQYIILILILIFIQINRASFEHKLLSSLSDATGEFHDQEQQGLGVRGRIYMV